MTDLNKIRTGISNITKNRFFLLICYLYIVFNGPSLVYGWGGIFGMLYKSGAFEELCEKASDRTYVSINGKSYIDCGARQYEISLLSSLSTLFHITCSPVGGFMLDILGNKICFIFSQVGYIISLAILAFFYRNKYALRIAFSVMGLVIEGQVAPIIFISRSFPKREYTVISLTGSIRSLSFALPIIMNKVFSSSIYKPEDFRALCIIHMLFSALPPLFLGIWIIPWNSNKDENVEEVNEVKNEEAKPLMKFDMHALCGNILKVCKSPHTLELVLAIVCIFTNMARIELLNKLQVYLYATSDGRSAAEVVSYFTVLAFVCTPLMGYISDKFGPPTTLVLLQIASVNAIIFVIFDNIVTKYISSVFYLISHSFFVSCIYSFTAWRFPKEQFGKLSALTFCTVGLLLTTNIGLIKIAADDVFEWAPNNYKVIPYICLAHSGVGLIAAITLFYYSRKVDREKEEAKDIEEKGT